MPPDPSDLASMHGRVVEWLGGQIATGRLHGVLDLDHVAQLFGVSRSLVRECLRTLAAKGMVQARQRTGTLVTDPDHWALLDEQVIRWRAAGPQRFVQMQESLQVRQRVEPLAATLMAQQGSAEHLGLLVEATRRIEAAIAAEDGQAMVEADTAYHRELYLGSGNSMLARLAGTVHACLRVPEFQGYQRFSWDTVARHNRLTESILAGDEAAAEEAAIALMTVTSELFHAAWESVMERRQASTEGRAGATPLASAPGPDHKQPRRKGA